MLIGIDGGGTKTKGVLCDNNLNIIKSLTTTSTNYNSIGIEKSIGILKCLIKDLSFGYDISDIKISMGIAGIGGDHEKKLFIDGLANTINHNNLFVCGDDVISLYSSGLTNNVVVLIAGTGSVCISLYDKEIKNIGGLGHILGDEGSGFYIVKEAIKLSLEENQHKNMISPLLSDLFKYFESENLTKLLFTFYKKNKAEIASASSLVLSHYESSSVVKEIVNRSVEYLKNMISLATNNKESSIVLQGGILANDTVVRQLLLNSLSKSYKIITAKYEPAVGAIVAMQKLK